MKILTLDEMNAVSGGTGHSKKTSKHSANHSAKASSATPLAASSMSHAASSEAEGSCIC